METDFRGSFQIYSEMKPGTVFAFRNKDGARQLAMKAQYERHGRPASNHIIRFYEAGGAEAATVCLVRSDDFTRAHTLLALGGLKIGPIDWLDFVGPIELDEKLVESGWLGFTEGRALLTFRVDDPSSSIKVGAVDLMNHMMLDNVPLAAWYKKWRIYRPAEPSPEIIFAME